MMTMWRICRGLLASACAAALAGCGGSGGSSGTNFIPSPPVTPTPTPTPISTPIAPAHLGLVSPSPFAVLGIGDTHKTDSAGNSPAPVSPPAPKDVQFSFDAATNSYQISVPGFQPGTLASTSYNGTSGQPATGSTSRVTSGSSSTLQSLFITLPVPGTHFSPYTYTSLGEWYGQTGVSATGDLLNASGSFAYGIPTQSGGVPVTGSATYIAMIDGATVDGEFVSGDATLQFNFAAGTLAGHLDPTLCPFDCESLGRYDFTNTVFGVGSTSFSGTLSKAGLPGTGSFDGLFTGPTGEELMARWSAPYQQPGSSQTGQMFGVLVGKRP